MGYYDATAKGYDELHGEEQQRKVAIIKTLIWPKKGERLLDVGCGTGIATTPWDCVRVGIDPSPGLLARAADKEQVSYVCASAEAIPFPDGSFDYVICVTALHHVRDIDRALAEMVRVGKNSFVLSVLKKSPRHDDILETIERHLHIIKRHDDTHDLIVKCSRKL